MENSESSLKKIYIYNTVGSLVYFLCQWLLTVIVVNQAGLTVGGELSLALSFANVYVLIATFNSRGYQVSDLNSKYTDQNYIAFRVLSIFVAFIIVISVVLLKGYPPHKIMVIIAFIIYKAIETIIDVFHGIFQKRWRMDIIFYSLSLRGLASIISLYLMLLFTNNLIFSIIVMAIVTAFIGCIIDLKFATSQMEVKAKITYSTILGLVKACAPLLIFSTLVTLSSTIPRLVLDSYCGSEALGIFTSIAMPAMIIQISANMILSPIYTLFARHYLDNNFKKLKMMYYKCLLIILAISIAAIVGAMFFGKLGLYLIYGDKLTKYTYLLVPMIVTSALTAFQLAVSALNVVMRNYLSLFISGLLGLIASLVLSPILIKADEMTGANNVMIITLIIQILICAGFIYRDLKRERGPIQV
jgi:Membrane protein involved in the export of O-antigen and teichoic acid